jgi:hypothetical protein
VDVIASVTGYEQLLSLLGEAELLFDVISTAYERTSVIVTTNLPFEQWTEVLGSQRLVGAMLDRLTHRCHILEASGESFRLQDAKRRLRRGHEPRRGAGAEKRGEKGGGREGS